MQKLTDILTNNKISEQAQKALFSEMAYQKVAWNEDTTSSAGIHTDAEFLVFIQSYLSEAIDIVSRGAEPQVSLEASHVIRKITTMVLSSAVINKWDDTLLSKDSGMFQDINVVTTLSHFQCHLNNAIQANVFYTSNVMQDSLSYIFWLGMKVMSSSEEFAPLR